MTGKDTAYRTTDPEIVIAYWQWRDQALGIRKSRMELIDVIGRESRCPPTTQRVSRTRLRWNRG